ncbi:MAG: hypothetical protein JWO05_1151 [Gemmatimonadetes bacterium]|nr:hypothetical protein [Gemmatimonadota bacterium]
MSATSDLLVAFSEVELTHPVQYGAESTRGFLNRSGEARHVLGVDVEVAADVLFLRTDALPDLAEETPITVGALGAASAVGGTVWLVQQLFPVDDGTIVAAALAGGRA